MLSILLYLLINHSVNTIQSQSGITALSESDTSAQATLYFFTGSDWCVNCRRFEKKVLHDSAFKEFLGVSSLKVIVIDFPQRKKQDQAVVKYNNEISDSLGFDGTFPGFIVTSANNGKKSTINYNNETPEEFANLIKRTIAEFK